MQQVPKKPRQLSEQAKTSQTIRQMKRAREADHKAAQRAYEQKRNPR